MAAGDRGRYELLAHAVESRLNTALRIDQGDGYGVNVKYERLRDGTTYLLASTFVADPTLGRTLAALRGQWQRWGRDGFDAGEINVARWRYAANLSSAYASANTFAFQLLHAWGVEPALLEPRNLRADVARPGRRARRRAVRHLPRQRGPRPDRQRAGHPPRARSRLARVDARRAPRRQLSAGKDRQGAGAPAATGAGLAAPSVIRTSDRIAAWRTSASLG